MHKKFFKRPLTYSPGTRTLTIVTLEEDLKVFTIYGLGGHLGHVTSIMSSDFHFLVPESFHTKFGSDQHSSF